MASQKQLAYTRVIRKSDSNSQVPAPPFTMVARRRQCAHRPTITPNRTCSANPYRHIKRRVGRSLKQTHCQRGLVTARKQTACKLSGTESSLSRFERVPRPLYSQNSTCSNRQHHSGVLHKRGRGHEIGPSVCPTVEDFDLVHQETSNSQRGLVTARKQTACKLSGTESSLSRFERVPRPLYSQNSTCSNRQHHSGVLHKRGRGHEIGPSVCPTVEDFDLVHQETSNSQSPTHTRPAERGSRQAIQARLDHSNRVVPPSRGLSSYMQKVAPASGRPIRHEVQQQITSVRVTGSGSPSYGSGCTQSAMGVSGEIAGHPMQEDHCDCPGVAQHALVLGSGNHVQSNPAKPARCAQPVDTALQSDPSQKSEKSKSPCMALRALAIKEQGFSEAVAARIEAPQRGSTRSVYEAKWSIFTKWCLAHQVDFRAPL